MNTLFDFNKFDLSNVENARKHFNIHKLIIIWLEVPVDNSNNNIFSESKIFDDRDECIDYITTNIY
jgi:hypothetical protein